MQTAMVYIIGGLAVIYVILNIWRNIKGKGSCCNSCSGKCGSDKGGKVCQ